MMDMRFRMARIRMEKLQAARMAREALAMVSMVPQVRRVN